MAGIVAFNLQYAIVQSRIHARAPRMGRRVSAHMHSVPWPAHGLAEVASQHWMQLDGEAAVGSGRWGGPYLGLIPYGNVPAQTVFNL